MTLPQDTRGPHRQQRWIELENVGGTTIPPFGVVEIVESYRPEAGGLSGDGPTVVKVKRPTIDSLPHFYVNGPVEIPVGRRGEPGTNDFPCMAAYDQQTAPVSGQMWGTIRDSYLIGRGRQGVAIVGDADAQLGIVRINRTERLLRVTPAQSALMPGETETCYVLRWNGTTWQTTTTLIPVADPMFRTCALPGEEFWCEAYGDSFQTVSEFGLRRRGIVEPDPIQPNSTGLVTFSSITPPPIASCIGNRLGPTVDACYRTQSGTAVNVGEEVFVHYHTEFRRWFILPLGTTLIRFEMRTKLPLGGMGEAVEISTGPAFTRIGSNFPIKDPWRERGKWRYDPRSGSQARGYMGWCLLPANPEFYNGQAVREIVDMEQIARSIEFTLAQDLQGSQAQAVVNKYYLGKDPSETDLFVIPGWGGIRVYDDTGNYPRALGGAKGKARYNEFLHRYEIIECNQMAILLKATCGEICPNDPSTYVGDYAAMTFPPYGQEPVNVTEAINSMGLAHEGEGRFILVWDESLDQWDILQVPHISQYVATLVNITQGNCTIVVQTVLKELAAMTCGNVDLDADQIGLTTYDVVTDISISHEPGSGGSGSTGPTAGVCNFTVNKTPVCGLPGVGTPSIDIIQMTPMLAVQDVFVDGLCVKGTVIIGYVFCLDDEDEVTFYCGTECNSGSGSGQ